MNDRTEFAFGLEILEIILAHGEGAETWPADLHEEVMRSIALMKRSHQGTYVLSASFCRKGNVLSQWRAYGKRDGAIAIGFDLNHLRDRASAQSFACGRVHYYWAEALGRPEDERFSAWLEQRCRDLVTRLADTHRSDSEEEPIGEEMSEILRQARHRTTLEHWIAEVAAFIKHPAFSEEVEWRVVAIERPVGLGKERPILDRSAGAKVIPFVNFGLRATEDRYLGMRQLVIGPTADPEAVSHAASHLMRQVGTRDGFSIAYPFHPLRPPP